MRTGFAGWHILQEGMRLLSLLICSTFVIDVSGNHFLFLNVIFVFIWLTCLVSVIGVPPLSFSCLSDCVVVISCKRVWCSSVSFWCFSVYLVEMCCTCE